MPPQTQVQRSAAPEQLISLTPLRGLAALWVVFYHLGWQSFPLHTEAVTPLLTKGYLAVDFFFLLSGFVLSHVYWRAFADSVQRRAYSAFLKARVARLYPLHIAVLCAFAAAAIVFVAAHVPGRSLPVWGPQSLTAFVANLGMLQGLDAAHLSWNYPTWSISLECLAYLGLPFVLTLVVRAHRAPKAAVALALLAVLFLLARSHDGKLDQWTGLLSFVRSLPEFLLGVLIYDAWRSLPPVRHSLAVAALGLGGLLALHVGAPDSFVVLLFALFIPLSVWATGRTAAFMNWRGFVWLGEISYALYLIHGFVQYFFQAMIRGAGLGDPSAYGWPVSLTLVGAAAMTSLALAGLAHRFIERPAQRALRRRFAATAPDARQSANGLANSPIAT